MKVLVLSCATGGGHNAAGRGICDALEQKGHTADFMGDYLSLAGEKVNKTVCSIYIKSVTVMPWAFKGVYHIGRGVSTFNHKVGLKSPVYYANARMARYLDKIIEDGRYDAIVMPHLFPAETLAGMKSKGNRIPLTVAVATDYTSIPFWEETDCDYYIVPHKDCVPDFARRGIDESKIIPLGIPAPKAFSCRKSHIQYELIGMKSGKNVLVMGGSMGAGKIPSLIRALKREFVKNRMQDSGIIVVCGRNRKLYRRLRLFHKNDKQVTILKYINNVADYMRECDLLYTKPGGLTATQSAIMRIPTIFMEPISDCERANSELFVRYGMALAPDGIEETAREGMKLLQSEEARIRMQEAQGRTVEDNCALKFVEILEGLVDKNV